MIRFAGRTNQNLPFVTTSHLSRASIFLSVFVNIGGSQPAVPASGGLQMHEADLAQPRTFRRTCTFWHEHARFLFVPDHCALLAAD
jgi:hypothetical protein